MAYSVRSTERENCASYFRDGTLVLNLAECPGERLLGLGNHDRDVPALRRGRPARRQRQAPQSRRASRLGLITAHYVNKRTEPKPAAPSRCVTSLPLVARQLDIFSSVPLPPRHAALPLPPVWFRPSGRFSAISWRSTGLLVGFVSLSRARNRSALRQPKVHGIGNETVADHPAFEKVAPEVAKLLSDCDIGGYGVRGDVQSDRARNGTRRRQVVARGSRDHRRTADMADRVRAPYRGAVAADHPDFLEWMQSKDFPRSTLDVARRSAALPAAPPSRRR